MRYLNTLLFSSLLISIPAIAGDIDLEASIESNAYVFDEVTTNTYSVEDKTALELVPSITAIYDSEILLSRFNIKHRTINHQSSSIGTQNITEYAFNNTFTFLTDRLAFNLDATRKPEAIDDRDSFIQDPLFGDVNFNDVDRYTVGMSFDNANVHDVNVLFDLSATKTDNDLKLSDIDSEQAVFSPNQQGTQYQTSGEVSFGSQINKMYGDIRFEGNLEERDNFGDQERTQINANGGIPIYQRWGLALNASHEKNSVDNSGLSSSEISYDSAGAGLSYRFSPRSYAEITYNKSDQGDDDNFWAYRANWQPSIRTTLEAEFSRRFYGDSSRVNFSWLHKRFSMDAQYSEELNTYTRFNPINDTLPEPIQDLLGDTTLYTAEDVVALTKTGTVGAQYQQKTYTVTSNISTNKRKLFEDNSEQDNIQFELGVSFQLGYRNTLDFNGAISELDYSDQDREDTTKTFTSTLQRTLTEQSSASINFRVSSRDSNVNESLMDRRLWINYTYDF